MKSAIAVVALLTACGPGQGLNDRWTVRKPVQVIIEDQPLDSTEARRALAEGLRQLGFQTTETGAGQTITAVRDDCADLPPVSPALTGELETHVLRTSRAARAAW